MIDYIRGVVRHWEKGLVIVAPSTNLDVGVQCLIPANMHYEVDDEATFYTNLSLVSGNNGSSFTPRLYGFATERCRDVFLLLQEVNGVGARAALRVLSLGSGEVLEAIRDREPARLKVRGVGPKITKRIVDDLHKKVESGAAA